MTGSAGDLPYSARATPKWPVMSPSWDLTRPPRIDTVMQVRTAAVVDE